jgi:Ni,Fe-hydrogenase III large subunit
MTNLNRDIRSSHPFSLYADLDHIPVLKRHGDVYSRIQVRKEEIEQSIRYIRKLISDVPVLSATENIGTTLAPDSFCLSLVEGWRGEICHCALTDSKGELMMYKIKDPSFNNWLALALSVRNNEISDFPICNKSFNFSYSGHDL